MKKVMFLGTHNSCRSQMAEALVNHHFRTVLKAYSAGVDPGEIHPKTEEVLAEIGLDISDHTANRPEDFEDLQFDYVITLCNHAREVCPVYWTRGEARYEHMEFDDPRNVTGSDEKVIQAFREARDGIEERLLKYFDNEIQNEHIERQTVEY